MLFSKRLEWDELLNEAFALKKFVIAHRMERERVEKAITPG